jgi:hypothetical protein
MSPLDAAARTRAPVTAGTGARPAAPRPGRTARPTPVRPRLTVVPPLRAPAPRAPFVLLVGGLLVAGLASLLLLHTSIAEDSFRLHDLSVRSAALADRQQALEQEIAAAAAPQELAARAARLGMVPSENPVFIRISDGRILGKPKAGVAPPPPATVTPKPSTGAAQATARTTNPPKAAKPAKPSTPAPSPTQGGR